MNTWKTSLKTAAIAMVLVGGNLLVPGRIQAYDGDVDYSAPYLTVDPETGKLVTIDPKAQTQQQSQAQHPATGPSASTQPPATENNNTATSSGSDVMAQGNGAGTTTTTTNGQAGTGSLVKPFIVTVVLSGIILFFIVLSRRSKPAKPAGTDNNGSSADH